MMTPLELHAVFAAIALVAGVFGAVLVLVIIGIRRGDRGKRLVGKSSGPTEAFARRLLTGSLRCDDAEDGQ